LTYPAWETFTVCDIENGPVEIVDLLINSRVIFHSYVNVYQRVLWQMLWHIRHILWKFLMVSRSFACLAFTGATFVATNPQRMQITWMCSLQTPRCKGSVQSWKTTKPKGTKIRKETAKQLNISWKSWNVSHSPTAILKPNNDTGSRDGHGEEHRLQPQMFELVPLISYYVILFPIATVSHCLVYSQKKAGFFQHRLGRDQ
jgi:hypothetical protein